MMMRNIPTYGITRVTLPLLVWPLSSAVGAKSDDRQPTASQSATRVAHYTAKTFRDVNMADASRACILCPEPLPQEYRQLYMRLAVR